MPTKLRTILWCAVFTTICSTAHAQIKTESADSLLSYGDAHVMRYRVGVSLTANRGAVRDVFAAIPVPLECAEQQVTLLEEDFSDAVASSDYRELQGGNAKQLLIKMPYVANGVEAHAILTFEVRTKPILPPDAEVTANLVVPSKKLISKQSKALKRYLSKSPKIETNHSKLKKIVREIFAKLEQPGEAASATAQSPSDSQPTITDWQRVKAIYDYVQDTIEYREQDDKSALATLKDGHGDCQNVSALFIALCRTAKIPARQVWVHQHAYSEFCLADADGNLHWFPCETAGGSAAGGAVGLRAFAQMPTPRVIMQKGDNFRVPEQRKTLTYAAEHMTALPATPSGGKPSHKFIRQQL